MKNGRTGPNQVEVKYHNGGTLGTEEKHRLVMDSINDAVYRINPHGFFTYLNDTALKLTGLTPETYHSCHFLDLVIPEHRDTVRSRFERAMNGEENPPYELHVNGNGGCMHVVEVKSKPIFENGSVVEMLGVARDVTARKQAEELILNANAHLERMADERTKELQEKTVQLRDSETRYRAIFENTGTAMMILDEGSTILLVNAEAERMTGYARSELEQRKKWTEFFSESDVRQIHSSLNGKKGAALLKPRPYECQVVDRFGQIRDVLALLSRIPGTNESIVSLLDITERKLAEETIGKREEELHAKTLDLEELNTALKVLLKRMDDDRRDLEERVASNIQDLVLPHLAKLKKHPLGAREKSHINVIESNLQVIISPFIQKLSSRLLNLTPKEIQISHLIKEGRTTKEIAEIMDVSKSAIDTHRHHIRKKLGLKNKKMNMRSYLHSLT
jgi:PAS domain S-box-containing protein